MRQTPVARQADGSYVVSTYAEIVELLHDPRISSDQRNVAGGDASGYTQSFIHADPPEHDRVRRIVMRHFGPPRTPGRVDAMEPSMRRIVARLIGGPAGSAEVDIVDQLAYPFPVAVICGLLGVPREDEPRFHVWVEAMVAGLDPRGGDPGEGERKRAGAPHD